MDSSRIFAHTKKDPITDAVLPEERWQTLDAHLQTVAQIAENAAAEFGAGEFARAAGLLHDIGKATDAFQKRLRGSKTPADHKTEGGRISVERYGKHIGKLLAYIICGHHTGLPDDFSDGASGLNEMLRRTGDKLLCDIPETSSNIMPQKTTVSQNRVHQAFYLTMLIRMVFSALVDADYLDTEAFSSPENRSSARNFRRFRSIASCSRKNCKNYLINRRTTR